jgi:hypothetical protein
MDDTLPVGIVERRGDRARMMDGLFHRQQVLSIEPLAQRFSFDVRHDVVEKAVGFAGVVEREDVGVVQSRSDLDLA